MNIALIAHDNRKDELVDFVCKYEDLLAKHHFYTTGTTGKRILERTGLNITRLLSGPYGGDQQIGALVAQGEIAAIFFFRDPLTSQPHEPDVSALIRLCDVHRVPIATNLGSAEWFMKTLALQGGI